MTQREEYSVGQLARLSGVSVRTLHHYDKIGLLSPAHKASNGYRFYGRAEALRLQEILFYREVGFPLGEIALLLGNREDAVERLTRHRARLAQRMDQTSRAIDTLDLTIAHLKGDRDMAIEDLYQPFAPARQAEYEAWLIDTYGADMAGRIAASKQAIAEAPAGLEGLMTRLRDIESRLVEAYEAGHEPGADELVGMLGDHRALMGEFWGRECDAAAYAGLADMYLGHPDFVARYERLSPRFSGWLPAAMKVYAGRL